MKRSLFIFTILFSLGFLANATPANAQAFSCPALSAQQAALTVKGIYNKVLERDADDGGLVLFAGKLSGGGWCVQHVVRAIGVSPEYAERFIKNQVPRQAITLMYRHFLLRSPESEAVIVHHVNELNAKGWQAKVLDFVNSPEAQSTWGKFQPSIMSNVFEASGTEAALQAAGCKLFLGRKGNYLCTTTSGYNMCESKRKDAANGITACQLAGVDSSVHNALAAKGCSRNSAGEYTCMTKPALDMCEGFLKSNKVKACKRTPIKIGGNQ